MPNYVDVGTTAKLTTDDSPVKLFDIPASSGASMFCLSWRGIILDNSCANRGQWSPDGGTTWLNLPPNYIVRLETMLLVGSVWIRRIAGGANLTGIYATAWAV